MSEREKIQQSIAALEAQRATLGDAVVDPAIAALRKQLEALEPQKPAEQQRKYVTVLFADVSGFTAMSETLDAEEVAEIMNALWQRLDAAITEHRGHIDKHIGDAVMALFGAEEAHEDDPERAIEAALAMQVEIQTFNAQRPQQPALNMRIGINTGRVLLGEVGSTHEFTAMGDTVNLASRLEHAAPVGGILISHDTYRHVRGVFDVTPQEPIIVKGKQEPVHTYIVTRKKPRTFRLRTRGVEGIETRMIGRDAELRQMQDAFATVIEDRELQMVTISGEAGIGKSRLLYEFEHWAELQPEEYRLFKGRASDQTRNLPYVLIRDLFAFRFQITDSDPLAVVHDKLEHGIAEFMGPGHAEQTHFIGHLIGYPFAESPYLRGILEDPKQIRNIALHALTQFFAAVTSSPLKKPTPAPSQEGNIPTSAPSQEGMPAVILLEDLHWADEGSLEVIQHLVQECRSVPLLIICCTRPLLFERRPLWGEGQEPHTRLELRPLSTRDSRRLVREILQHVTNLPAELRDLIVNGAEGNPFYVEELIKMLIEEGGIIKDEAQWWVEPARLAEITVPPTLFGVLQARLDRLPETERDVLQRASVIGRVFWDKAVKTLMCGRHGQHTPPPLSRIRNTLHMLRSRELIFGREASAFEDTHEYIFKHALLRDVTYESVLLRQRRDLHAQAAAWLIEQSGERVSEFAGLIAEHYEKARQTVTAIKWYARAGQQAQDAYAPDTAIAYYQSALTLLDEVYTSETCESPEVSQQRLTLCEGLGHVLLSRARYAEASEAYTAMRATAEASENVSAQARAWIGLSRAQVLQGDNRTALVSADQAETLAKIGGSTTQRELIRALLRKCVVWLRVGTAEEVLLLAKEALARSAEVDARPEMAHSLRVLGGSYFRLGQYDQAVSYAEQALTLYRELGDREWVAYTVNLNAESARFRGDYPAALQGYQESVTMAREIGDRPAEMMFLSNLGCVRVEFGDYASAEAELQQVIQMVGDTSWQSASETYSFLARACLGQGKVEEAVHAAHQAMTLAQESENSRMIGLAWRVLGQVAAVVSSVHLGESDYTAADCFAESQQISKERSMEGEQAHTLKAWADYELKQGDHAKGEALWQEARALFEKLGMALLVDQMDAEASSKKRS